MDIFRDDATGADKDRIELARKAVADAGGPAIGSGAQQAKDKQDKEARQRDSAFQQTMTALQQWLLDPVYRQQFQDTNDAIARAQDALDVAFAEYLRREEELEGKAAKLPNGRAVFLRADGRGETKDGDNIPLSIMATLDIPADAPTMDDYNALRQHGSMLAERAEDLDALREAVNNSDSPPSLEELKAALERADDIAESVQPSSKASAEMDGTKTETPTTLPRPPADGGSPPVQPGR